MQETIKEKIERFKKFNLKLIEQVNSLPEKGPENIHTTILLCSIFDSLSKSRFPNEKKNAIRFKKLIQECKQWPESQHLSLLHVVRAFEVNSGFSDKFKELKDWSFTKLTECLPNSSSIVQRSPGIEINIDPHVSEIEIMWPKDSKSQNLKIGGKDLFHFKHENMFWCYRNSVVHEYRIPGNGAESISQSVDYPYYMKVSSIESASSTSIYFSNKWELFYPMNFFERMCHIALDIVSTYHIENQTSPFEVYSDGSYWIPSFNDD
jgi:hypothetical protein